MKAWPAIDYNEWSRTCDTLHAHTQVLGKLAAALAPREPQFQHLALRLTARGWETAPLPAPDRSGCLGVTLDLRTHEAIAEHSDGRTRRIALTPNRSVRDVTRELLSALGQMGGGSLRFDPSPQEVPWSVPLDEDDEHCHYDPNEACRYFTAATQAALVLTQLRAPYDGRSTAVNAWWGSFDIAVSFFSDLPEQKQGAKARVAEAPEPDGADSAEQPSVQQEPERGHKTTQEVAVGWWPGDGRYGKAAFYAYANPLPEGFENAALSPPAARWEAQLGEYVLDWDDVRSASDPRAFSLTFARSALSHGHMAPALTV